MLWIKTTIQITCACVLHSRTMHCICMCLCARTQMYFNDMYKLLFIWCLYIGIEPKNNWIKICCCCYLSVWLKRNISCVVVFVDCRFQEKFFSLYTFNILYSTLTSLLNISNQTQQQKIEIKRIKIFFYNLPTKPIVSYSFVH